MRSNGKEALDKRGTLLKLPTPAMEQFIEIAQERGITRGELLREAMLEWLAGQSGGSED
ncbi:ribbon-helix-helix protein, CopG family [Leptolyngbya sp. Heron Island J]|uniref:ribbon-helix-helix protein, CopG family n=1 Tax=Leptolyngbya sp. Heron Island J TaxID=1385935 RepID=UPI002E161A6E